MRSVRLYTLTHKIANNFPIKIFLISWFQLSIPFKSNLTYISYGASGYMTCDSSTSEQFCVSLFLWKDSKYNIIKYSSSQVCLHYNLHCLPNILHHLLHDGSFHFLLNPSHINLRSSFCQYFFFHLFLKWTQVVCRQAYIWKSPLFLGIKIL